MSAAVSILISELKGRVEYEGPQTVSCTVQKLIDALAELDSGILPPGTFTPGAVPFGAADGSLTQRAPGITWDNVAGFSTNLGQVATGTATPAFSFFVNYAGSSTVGERAWYFSQASPTVLQFNRYNGTYIAPAALASGDIIQQIIVGGHDGTAQRNTAGVSFFSAAEAWTTTARGVNYTVQLGTLGATAVRTVFEACADGTISTPVTYTVAALPTPPLINLPGTKSFVSDATAPVFAAAVVGGGAVGCPVYWDGAAWRCG